MENEQEQIVVFDFDKTITSVDTFTRLIVFLINQSLGRQLFSLPFLPVIYSLKPFKSTRPLAVSLGLWVASVGRNKRKLISLIKEYASQRKVLGPHDVMRLRALYAIKLHLTLGHKVIIVSASSRCWIKHFLGPALSSRVTIIGSRLKFKWKGLVLGSWCYGDEKLNHFSLRGFENNNWRTMYSDCPTDISLMQRARNRCFINAPDSLQQDFPATERFYFLRWNY